MGLFKKSKTFASGASYTLLDEDDNELQNLQLNAVKHYIWNGGSTIPLYREKSLSDYIQQISKNGLKSRWDKVLRETNTVGEFGSFSQKWSELNNIRYYPHMYHKPIYAYYMEEACVNYIKSLEGTQDIHFYSVSFGEVDSVEILMEAMVKHWGYDRDTGILTKVPYNSPVYFRGIQKTPWGNNNIEFSNGYHTYSGFNSEDDSLFVDRDIPQILPHMPRYHKLNKSDTPVALIVFVEEYDNQLGRVVKKQVRMTLGKLGNYHISNTFILATEQYIHNTPPLPLPYFKKAPPIAKGRYLTASYKVRGQYKKFTEDFSTVESLHKLLPFTSKKMIENIQYPIIPLRWNDVDMDSNDSSYVIHKNYYKKMIKILGYDPKEFMDSLRNSVGNDWGRIDGAALHVACPILHLKSSNEEYPKSLRKYHELFAKWVIQNAYYTAIHFPDQFMGGIMGFYSDRICTEYTLLSDVYRQYLVYDPVGTSFGYRFIDMRRSLNTLQGNSRIGNRLLPEKYMVSIDYVGDSLRLIYDYTGKYGQLHRQAHYAHNYARLYSVETGFWKEPDKTSLDEKYIPLIIPLLKQLSPADQEDLVQRSMRVTMYAKDTVKVYRSWVKPILQIGTFVLSVVIILKSFGTGVKLSAALLKAATSLVVGIAIDKVINFAVKIGIISPKVATIIKIVAQLTIIAKGAGWNFSKILTAPNLMKAVNLSFDYYNKKQAWEMQEIQKQQNEHNRMHQSRMEALAEKQKMVDLGVASDPSLYLNMPSFAPTVNLFETPEMMYARHYNFNVVDLSLGMVSNLTDGLKHRQVDRTQEVRDITKEIEDVLLIT